MAFTIYARMKRAGKQKKEELIPVPFELEARPETVGELLTALVRLSVREYNGRKDEGQVLKFLTKEEIAGRRLPGRSRLASTGAAPLMRTRRWRMRSNALRTESTGYLPGLRS